MSAFEDEHEEQIMEAEALESIFADEFEQLSASPFCWRVHLQPHAPGEEEENHVVITLEAKIPPAYPNEVPELDVVVVKGLTEDQRKTLLGLANEKTQENLGMAMIYTIAEELKEWLLAHNEPPKDNSMFAAMQRREQEKTSPAAAAPSSGGEDSGGRVLTEQERLDIEQLERSKQKELDGTVVTAESFAAWRAGFDEEMTPAVDVAADKAALKPTGREYFAAITELDSWEEPPAGDDEGEGAEDAGGGGGGGVGDAGLFGGEDDDSDFDDLSDDDDDDDDDEEEED